MSDRPLEEIADFLVRRALEHGATAADTVVSNGESLMVGVRLGEVEKVQRADAKHLGLRVLMGKRTAVTSTADFSHDALERLAEETVHLARVTAEDPCSGLPEDGELATEIPDLDLYDPQVGQITAEQAVEWCRAAEAAALEADPRITNSEGAELGSGSARIVYRASNGFTGSYRTSSCSLSVVPLARDNGSMERDYWYTAHRKLDRLESPEAVGRRAAERTLRRLNPRQVPTREVPVVFDPEMASSLLRHLAGAVSGNALYRGTSFLIGKLGEKIAAPQVTVFDDGRLADGMASRPFDAEGVNTRRNGIVAEGRLQAYLFDTYSGRKLDARTTGNASRSIADVPHVSPTNFVLQPGEQTPEEIIASVENGLYVTELMGFGVNPVTGDYSRGAGGLWIENGQLTYPVAEITIAGNLLRMFEQIEAIANDLTLRHAVTAPTLRIARMTVGGN